MNLNADVLREKLKLNAEDYDFYRCYKCSRLITRVEEIQFFTPGTKLYGKVCRCGSMKYRPEQFQWWMLFIPRVALFAFYRMRGLV